MIRDDTIKRRKGAAAMQSNVTHLKNMIGVLGFLFPFVGGYVPLFQCPQICLCDSEITSCQYNGLTELPNGINPNVNSLDLSYNSFEIFPTGMSLFAELQYLNLSNNQISTLKFSDLEGLTNLKRLDLTYNFFHDWKDIHSSTFLSVNKLQFLDFSNNPLRSIPKYSNHLYIESLEILKFINCSMRTIPVNIFNRLTNLKELYLSANPIINVNETFLLHNLKYLELSFCHLNYIDVNSFSSMENLETVILNNNIHLKKLSINSDKILYLDLSNSMLERIPSGYLTRLTKLNLSGNILKYLPKNSFSNYYNLQTLNLSTNALTEIHQLAFEGLTEVITIDLSYNKLQMIPENLLHNNSALTHLNLSHNYIKYLDTISSKSLKMLSVSHCEIYEINRYSLSLMPSLMSLTLSRNYITSLPNRWIARSLVILDVSFCRIRALNNETFVEMFYLRQINLASNELTTIDPSYFPKAFNVIINDNPWRCECTQLKRMFQWVSTYSASRLDELICNSPEKVAGQTWEEACSKDWYPTNITRDTMWYYSLGIVVAMVFALFALVVLRKVKALQEQRARLEENSRQAEEAEALRRMRDRQREIQENENRNAPDPRELQRPPSYNEALLLPRVDASHPSLAGSLHSLASRDSLRGSSSDVAKKNKIRRKRGRRKSEERRASRLTLDSDSSDNQYPQLQTRNKLSQPVPLESDF